MASVVLAGLQSRPELNGATVELKAYDPKRSRFGVLCPGLTEPVKVAPKNLLLVEEDSDVESLRHRHVEVAHVPCRPELAGTRAICAAFQADSARWHVELEDGTTALLPSSCLKESGGSDLINPVVVGRRGAGETPVLLANTHIPCKQLIFEEAPAFHVKGDACGHIFFKAHRDRFQEFLQLPENVQQEVLKLPVSTDLVVSAEHGLARALNPAMSASPGVKPFHFGREVVFAQFQKAGYPILESQRERFWKYLRIVDRHAFSTELGSSVFLTLSYAQHSCDPNAYACETADGRYALIALKPIASGDDICISYLVDWKLLEPTQARRDHLRSWGFTCECTRCSAGSDTMRAFDCIGGPKGCQGSIYLHADNRMTDCDVCACRVDADLFSAVNGKLLHTDSGIVEVYRTMENNVGRITSPKQIEDVFVELKRNTVSDKHWISARLHDMLADFYGQLGDGARALRHMEMVLQFFRSNLSRPSLRNAFNQDKAADLLFKLDRRKEAVEMYCSALAQLKSCLPFGHKYIQETRESLLVCLGGGAAPRESELEKFRANAVKTCIERMEAQLCGEKLPEKPLITYDREEVLSLVRQQTRLAALHQQERNRSAENEAKRAEVREKVRRHHEEELLCGEAIAVRIRAERGLRQGDLNAAREVFDSLQVAVEKLDDLQTYPRLGEVRGSLWVTMAGALLQAGDAEQALGFAEQAAAALAPAAGDNSESSSRQGLQLAEAHAARARALLRLGRPGEAKEAAAAARRLAPVELEEDLASALAPVPAPFSRTARLCTACHEEVPKERLKAHKKKCPRRIVECKDCEARFPQSWAASHAPECEARAVACKLCGVDVPFWSMREHEDTRCQHSVASCPIDGCAWAGPRKDLESHREACAHRLVCCQFCLGEMRQHSLPSHVCPVVFGDDVCVGCHFRFDELAEVSTEDLSRAPALLLSHGRRACNHVAFCFGCAAVWKTRGSTCPQCRASYDNLTALPGFLMITVERKSSPSPKAPAPREEECPPYTTRMISPLDVHFTQKSIRERFRPFARDGVMQDISILDSVMELVKGSTPRDLEHLDVVWHQGEIFVAGTGNRRLCMWRLLTLLCPEHWGKMKVRFMSKASPTVKFERYLDTECNGKWIEIRYHRFVGQQITGDACWPKAGDPGIVCPEVWALFNRGSDAQT